MPKFSPHDIIREMEALIMRSKRRKERAEEHGYDTEEHERRIDIYKQVAIEQRDKQKTA